MSKMFGGIQGIVASDIQSRHNTIREVVLKQEHQKAQENAENAGTTEEKEKLVSEESPYKMCSTEGK